MRAHLTNRDYEQLSAYIDGQLTPAEKQKLEERLLAHADLQAALDEMNRTRALIRSAPRRRAPRNFTLTPAMVGAQKPARRGFNWNLFPVLSFTSAVATLALVAVLLFQMLPAQKLAQSTAMQQPDTELVADVVQQTMTAMQATASVVENAPLQSGQAAPTAVEKQTVPQAAQPQSPAMPAAMPTATPAMESFRALETAQPEAGAAVESTADVMQAAPEGTLEASPPVVAWGSNPNPEGVMGMGGGGGGNISSGSLLGPPVPGSSEGAMGKGGGGAGQPVMGENIVIPQESVNPEDTGAQNQMEDRAAPAQANPAISGTGPILGVPANEESGQIIDRKAILGQPGSEQPKEREAAPPQEAGEEAARAGEPGQEPPPATPFAFPLFQVVLVIVLAVIAIGTGTAAFILRKRAR